jgi:hypothetical protein
MFSLLFDSGHRVLLAQFAGVLSSADIERLHNALVAFVAHHGFTRGILDFSSVQANALPHSFLVKRARLPQILLRQERILVAPQQELYELARAQRCQLCRDRAKATALASLLATCGPDGEPRPRLPRGRPFGLHTGP